MQGRPTLQACVLSFSETQEREKVKKEKIRAIDVRLEGTRAIGPRRGFEYSIYTKTSQKERVSVMRQQH